MSKLQFFTPISSHQTTTREPNAQEHFHRLRPCERFFDFGQRSVHITHIKQNDIELVEDPEKEKHLVNYIGYLCKIVMIATVFLPVTVVAFIGKCIYRKANNFTLMPANSEPHITTFATDRLSNQTARPANSSVNQAARPARSSKFSELDRDISGKLNEFISRRDQVALSRVSKEKNAIFRIYQSQRKEITYHNITDQDLKDLVKQAPNLTTLHLIGCEELTEDGLKCLTQLKSLKNLKLKDYNQHRVRDLHCLTSLKGLTHLSLEKTPGALEFLNLAAFKQLHCLSLAGCNVKDEKLNELTALTSLQALDLGGCYQLTDKGMQVISSFSQLHTLHLGWCRGLSDAALRLLAGCKNLRDVDLNGTAISDDTLKAFSALPLQNLELECCLQITDAGLENFACFKELATLNLGYNNLDGSGFKHLTSLQNLITLNLSWCRSHLGNSGFQSLGLLTRLRSLNLCNTVVTNEDFTHLTSLVHLTTLNLERYTTNRELNDNSLKLFTAFTHLKNLKLNFSSLLTSNGLRSLSSLPLETLDLAAVIITDDVILHFTTLTHLKDLDLSFSDKLTMDGLKKLSTLKELRKINLSFCSIEKEDREILESLLNCKIEGISRKEWDELEKWKEEAGDYDR